MKKILLETSFSKIYILVVGLITILIVGGYFSYAMFTVNKEKKNVISIITGNLEYNLTVDGVETNQLIVNANTTRKFKVTLTNPNNRKARFNFYYVGNLDSDVTAYYTTMFGINTPPSEVGINLESNGTSGSSNTYLIRVTNNSASSKTVNLGVSVGLDYNDLSLPSNGHLFEKSDIAVDVLLAKANEEELDYNSISEEKQKEMWTFSHEAGEQQVGYTQEELTDYRYIGKSPNNYVSFNNETWRIIGVFTVEDENGNKEQRLKIIRDEQVGNYSWDNKVSGIGSSISAYGSNEWSDSLLQEVLNSGAYYNRTTGICPTGANGATAECDFTSNGLTESAKEMIGKTKWYLGGSSTYNDVTASMFYERERGTEVYSGRSTSWIGKVGLMYPTDYGYATSGGSTKNRMTCLDNDLYHWEGLNYSDCYNNDWLLRSVGQWTMLNFSILSYGAFIISDSGYAVTSATYYVYEIRPAVYLTSNVKITGGTGSSSNMYMLSL